MLESLKNKKVLIIVAHPDDEILGIGATMNKLIEEYNIQTRVIILGEGLTSRSKDRNQSEWRRALEIHKNNISSAQECIGYHSVKCYDLPDNRFDSIDLLDIIKIVEREKLDFGAEVIFTHHGGDVNIDHQKTFEAVITACRPLKHETVKTIITFETASGTEWRANTDPKHFLPNLFVSISKKNLNAKISAMECYEFEKRIFPHPRSPEALETQAKRWGIAVGTNYSEAFTIVRNIVK